jgi:hypothetical protein
MHVEIVVSPWSANEKVFLQCFSEEGRFPCPDRSACAGKERKTNKKATTEVSGGFMCLKHKYKVDKAWMTLYN